jgi:uncharacterized membrane protein
MVAGSLLQFLCAAALLIPSRAFWPYVTGVCLLAVGLTAILRHNLPQRRGLDRAISFGPLFLAVPMGVFGTDHFIAAREVSTIVPSWMPAHMFWTYFVGTALIAAAFSIVLRKYSTLAATLLGIMLFCFVAMIHIPGLVAQPKDRFALAILLRDSSFGAGALAFALAQAQHPVRGSRTMILLLRWVIAIAAVIFGVEHFLHPQYVPVIPLRQPMPAWFPAHALLAYITGGVLIACGVALLVNWHARSAAAWLGIFVFWVVMAVYLPILVANFGDISKGLNYFADTLVFSGAALLLAGILPEESPAGERVAAQLCRP